MPRVAKAKSSKDSSTANLGFEAKLWLAADKLRNNMDAAGIISSQDKWARRQCPFGLAKRARRVRLRGQQPKQSNATTRRLAIMNLAIRGIEADNGKEHADTFRIQHPDLRADYVLANPPFNGNAVDVGLMAQGSRKNKGNEWS